MSSFEFTDRGALAQLVTDLATSGVRAGLKIGKITQHYGMLMQTRVKANAQGRPGPRMQTGDYNRSINLKVGMEGASIAARVGTARPQGRRLEFGFVGADSLGRHYNQAPLPHFGPAFDQIAPLYEAAIAALGAGIFDDKSLPSLPSAPKSGGSGGYVSGYTRADGKKVGGYTRGSK